MFFMFVTIAGCRWTAPEEPADLDEQRMLEALGYTAEAEDAGAGEGVIVHLRDEVAAGTNLVVSGHGFDAQLVDMDGGLLHRWTLDPEAHGATPTRRYFRRAWVLDDGSLLALIEYHSLWRIAASGEVLWHVEEGNHHDLQVASDGLVYSLTAEPGAVTEDAVTAYTLDGRRVRRVSILEAVRRSELAPLLRGDDPLHVNSIQILDGGDALLSARAIHRLFVMDLDEGRVTRAIAGTFRRQHEARMLPGDRIVLFDNGRRATGSRALELALPSGDEVWSWAEPGLYSGCCGTVSRLSDGHTLVVSTTQGRAVEVTPSGEVVWDFRTPHRTAEGKVAKLFDVRRMPPVGELPWLER